MNARQLIERGFHIFPLRPRTKLPYPGSWKDYITNDPEKAELMYAGLIRIPSTSTKTGEPVEVDFSGCNWAVATGPSNLIVVDEDNKNGKNGRATLEALQQTHGPLAQTLVVGTPSGGYHYIYSGQCKQGANCLGEGLDVRSHGGYIVAPGQVIDKGSYAVIHDKPIAPCPTWIIEKQGMPLDRTVEAPVGEPMTEAERAELESALEHLQDCTYDELLHRGMEIHSAYPGPDGLEVWDNWCREVMSPEDYNPDTCAYKWNSFSHGEGTRTIASLFHEARQRGYGSAAQAFSGHVTQQFYIAPTLTAPTPVEVSNIEDDDFSEWSGIDEVSFPKREWVLQNRYIKGFLTGIIAPGGMGKSTATLIDAISICIGRDLLTGEEVEQGSVWVHNAEDPLKETKGRVLALCRFFDVDRTLIDRRLYVTSGRTLTLCFANKVGQGADVNWNDVMKALKYIEERSIIAAFFDPLIRVHNVDENSNEQFDKVFKALTYIAEARNMAVVPVHHSRKLNSSDGAGDMDSARGGSVMSASCRLMFTWSKMDDKTAEEFGVDKERKNWFTRLTDAKANLAPPLDRQIWFERHSVLIGNGDSYGALKLAELRRVEKVDPKQEENDFILAVAIRDFGDGRIRAISDLVKAVTSDPDWQDVGTVTATTLNNRFMRSQDVVTASGSHALRFVRDAARVPGNGGNGFRVEVL